jgi:poly(A) polymerase
MIPPKLKNIAAEFPQLTLVSRAAGNLGLEVYVIGGFVRDIFLNRTTGDMDFLCVGDGIKLAREAAKLISSRKKIQVFKNFGTAHFFDKGVDLEFVGARKESYNRNSRNPIVSPGSLDDDLRRRDFTINALAYSISPEDFGRFLDPFEGLDDLQKKIIRTPLNPDQTFSDDPLRMMRAIRFACQLGFDIHPDTFESISKNKSRIRIISRERISDELNKIISSTIPSYGFKLLFSSGLLKEIFPEMTDLQGVERKNKQTHKDNFYHTLQVLDNVAKKSDNLWLRWSAILHDIAKPMTKRFEPKVGWTFHGHEDKGARMVPGLFQRFKLPLDERMKYVQKLVKLHLRPIPLVRDNITDSALRRLLFEAGDDIDDLLVLCRADITSKNETKVKTFLKNLDRVEKKLKAIEEKDQLRNFQPPISGDEIMDLFNLPPNKIVGELKNGIRNAILEGTIGNNHQDALGHLKKLARKKGLNLSKK